MHFCEYSLWVEELLQQVETTVDWLWRIAATYLSVAKWFAWTVAEPSSYRYQLMMLKTIDTAINESRFWYV